MRRLVVLAHFDPRGVVGPHVRRQVDELAAVADLVVVSTAALDTASRAFLGERSRLVERDNTGYDFLSYRTGLQAARLEQYDEVSITNDSYVGPLVAADAIYAAMAGWSADFWGLTETDRVKHHVQSFFVTFRRTALESDAFGAFWSDLESLDDRSKVIRRHEVGMSRRLYRAGLTSAAYFTETDADRVLARRRVRWWALRRTGLPRSRADLALLRKRSAVPWNPSTALADRALGSARLPYVKIDVLRHDPYGLGSQRLLDLCEQQHPTAFEGVRSFLADTERFYPHRPAEALLPTPAVARALLGRVGYGRA